MSMTRALNNALSGLNAVSRGTEIVAANLANASTPGYARREVMLSPAGTGSNMGGVRVDGIARVINSGLLSETRLAAGARSDAATLAAFATQMEAALGIPGDPGSLASKLLAFDAALISASARPEDNLRLQSAADAANALVTKINETSRRIQAARTEADTAIAQDVETLNAALERVAYLNRRITIVTADGGDASSLMDSRQQTIDQISTIVPVQEVPRQAGHVALFSANGAVLLDGAKPAKFQFHVTGQITPVMSASSGALARLQSDGLDLTPGAMGLLDGGSLAANFKIRDELAPESQRELDHLALELHDRFSSASTDPTLAPGQPGLFTDDDGAATLAGLTGLAGRLSLNSIVESDTRTLRSGLGAPGAAAIGDNTQLLRLGEALHTLTPASPSGPFAGNGSLAERMAEFEARHITRRVSAEDRSAVRNNHFEGVSSQIMALGVDSDSEAQRILQYEHAYAANARVIQAVDEMLQNILRL